MNRKTLTGFMLALTAGIWGYVGVQFFKGTGGQEEEIFASETVSDERPVLNMGEKQELQLNYPDPFLKEEVRPAAVPVRKNTIPVKPPEKKQEKPVTPVYTWPNIVYKGLIKNNNQPDRLVGVIVINGQERIVRKGEKVNELLVAGIEKNRVELAYEQEKKMFMK